VYHLYTCATDHTVRQQQRLLVDYMATPTPTLRDMTNAGYEASACSPASVLLLYMDCATLNPQIIPEQRLLCSQDLHCAGWLLGQVDEAACVRDEPRAHQLPHQHREVGCHCCHARLEVVKQLAAVL
jgi:hypothetical protein